MPLTDEQRRHATRRFVKNAFLDESAVVPLNTDQISTALNAIDAAIGANPSNPIVSIAQNLAAAIPAETASVTNVAQKRMLVAMAIVGPTGVSL